MASVGSVKRPTHYTKALEKIRPKHLRLLVKPMSVIHKRHGKHTGGIAMHGEKVDTIVMHKSMAEQYLAHEFAHVALGHRDRPRDTIGKYVRDELEANQWMVRNWVEPNNMVGDRKHWIMNVMGQVMHDQNVPLDAAVKITKHQVRLLKMPPITEKEEKWCRSELRHWEKDLRKEGWKPKELSGTSRVKREEADKDMVVK